MIVIPFVLLCVKEYCKFSPAQKNVFSAKGAGFNVSLGQRPRKNPFPKTSAVSADQLQRSSQRHTAELNTVRVIREWRE
jgi:hypothetical protein